MEKQGMWFYLFCFAALSACIDPYTLQIGKYKSLLVVEGLITDENIPYGIKLSYTFQSADLATPEVTDAVVYITDETGNMASLTYSGGGIYKTDSTIFTGQTGKTYTLHINTSDGNKYESDPCQMLPVAGVDSVYYGKEEVPGTTEGKMLDGIEIYLDSNEGNGSQSYFRWTYEETWEFRLPYPQAYIYIDSENIIPVTAIKDHCWKSNESGEILVDLILPGNSDIIQKEPINFIQSDLSDRLTVRYSILVKQLSISQKEYDFWNSLKQVNENTGSIFDTQPYSIISNIHNVSNPDEKVLGYFSVSAEKEKRIYINPQDLGEMDLPQYNYGCYEIITNPGLYYHGSPPRDPNLCTFDYIYSLFMAAGVYSFVEPIYDSTGALSYIVFAFSSCSDCTLTGSINPPAFWTEK
ncbi:MAG: DUF4249 domain-containing protein [Bacteroidales bacterium]